MKRDDRGQLRDIDIDPGDMVAGGGDGERRVGSVWLRTWECGGAGPVRGGQPRDRLHKLLTGGRILTSQQKPRPVGVALSERAHCEPCQPASQSAPPHTNPVNSSLPTVPLLEVHPSP